MKRTSKFLQGTAVALVALSPGAAVYGQAVVADGSTATGVTVETAGNITIDIAPATNGTSFNAYSQFNVPEPGVGLDNRAVGATTIVNEVTSAAPSLIEGPLTVIGPSSHVIIANPNGIVVDGGRFETTGNVALTTGTVSTGAGGVLEASVSRGDLVVTDRGLSGTMEELGLIATALRINGAISFDDVSELNHLNILAGQGTVTFDDARLGNLPWAIATSGGSAHDQVIVDITSAASLNAGRISILVTDQGAGARIAGNSHALEGGFRLTSSGRIELLGADIEATGSVNVRGSEILVDGDTDEPGTIVSSGGGVVLETRGGDLVVRDTEISGDIIASNNLGSVGGVTLIAEGALRLLGETDAPVSLRSTTDGIALQSDGDVELTETELSSAADVRVSAGGILGLSNSELLAATDGRIFAGEAASIVQSRVLADANLSLEAAALTFGLAGDLDQSRTEIQAAAGGLVLRASEGGIANNGALLQGFLRDASRVDSLGGLSIYAATDIAHVSLSQDLLAVAFGEADDLYIQSGATISNETGRLFSNASVVLEAAGDILNVTGSTEMTGDVRIERGFGSRYAASLWLLRRRVSEIRAEFGDPQVEGEQALIIGSANVVMTASNVVNQGGAINGRTIDISATGSVFNAEQQFGRLAYRMTCGLFCRSQGSSDLFSLGGAISASEDVSITAGEAIELRGGQMVAGGDLELTAPLIASRPFAQFALIERPASFFRGRSQWVAGTYRFGSIGAFSGQVNLNGVADLGETQLTSLNEVIFNGSHIESDLSGAQPFAFGRRPLGVLWDLVE